MSNKLKSCRVEKMNVCSYRLQKRGIGSSERVKKRGFIIEDADEVLTIPFKPSTTDKRRQSEIKRTSDGMGKLVLTPSGQKVKVAITIDRCKDSEEEFRRVLNELLKGYEVELIKIEIEKCLESDM